MSARVRIIHIRSDAERATTRAWWSKSFGAQASCNEVKVPRELAVNFVVIALLAPVDLPEFVFQLAVRFDRGLLASSYLA